MIEPAHPPEASHTEPSPELFGQIRRELLHQTFTVSYLFMIFRS
jgi:hypothetical protein